MSSIHSYLIAYGLHQMQQVTGIEPADCPQPEDLKWAEDFERLLGTAWPEPKPDAPLTSIFSRVHLPEQEQKDSRTAKTAYLKPAPLKMKGETDKEKETLVPCHEPPGDFAAAKLSVGQEFQQTYAGLQQTVEADDPRYFTAFYHLMERFAWALPNTYGEPGVSLFQQWKAVAALVFASGGVEKGPAEDFILVGGDIPGIQDFVYTITSKGAAKGLRGRSFFLQLLGDAVVRRLVRDLELCPANVVYDAGGNFMVLGPRADAEVDGETVQKRLEGLQKKVDSALLDVFEGDLAFCLAWAPLQANQVGSHEFADPVSKHLKRLIAERKRQRFSAIAEERWNILFSPQGKPGNRYCVICQRPLARGEGVPMEGEPADLATGERPRRCHPCDGFKRLAEQIGQEEGLLVVGRKRSQGKSEPWQEALWQVGRTWYDYGLLEKLDPLPGSYLYTINDPDFLAGYAHGFTFIANVTPRVTREDVRRWKKETEKGTREEQPIHGGIRTFGQMADVARGVRRVGVLRMDVDDLGQIMVRGLKCRTLAATATLSKALDRFFAGRLNEICAEVNRLYQATGDGEDRGDRLYAIYAGGDDLFVVGSWDLMPELAERIQDEFQRYTGRNPALHISAGITLEGRKFPLYQAAERAGRAEKKAKEHRRKDVPKDAISFLGLAVKWDEWPQVTERLTEIIGAIGPGKASRALIHVLQNIYVQYEDQVELRHESLRERKMPLPEEPPYQIYYGPWMWREAYALTRMAKRVEDKDAKETILQLRVGTLSPLSIRYVGLAARWAELLTRKERET